MEDFLKKCIKTTKKKKTQNGSIELGAPQSQNELSHSQACAPTSDGVHVNEALRQNVTNGSAAL